MIWFIDNIQRLNRERRDIRNILDKEEWLSDAEWILHENQLCLRANIQAHNHYYLIRLIYPNTFPANPPSVYPQESNQHWSSHQYGIGGELCLEWGPDNWQEHITGADILRSTYKLLQIENPRGQEGFRVNASSRHFLNLGQDVRFDKLRFVCQNALKEFLDSISKTEIGMVKILLFTNFPSFTAFISNFESSNGEKWENPNLPIDIGKGAIEVDGLFFDTTLDSSQIKGLTKETFIELLVRSDITDNVVQNLKIPLFLISSKNGDLNLFWLSDNKKPYQFRRIDVQEKPYNVRLSLDLQHLSEKSIGLVGVGSVGSKVALSIARSGVRNFYLVDHDVFLPENICRHELNWEDVGQHKVDAVGYKLGLISRKINISTSKLMLSGQEASASVDSVLTKLGECDIIIDATADPSVFNQLSSIASRYKKPFIWLEVFAGGIGGLLARFRPGTDPIPKIMRAYLHYYLDNIDVPYPKSTANYSAVTGGGDVIVATDANVGVLASFATLMAIDLLIERVPSNFPYSMYLIGMSRGWIFEEPFYTIPIDISDVKIDPVKSEPNTGDLPDALEFLKELIEKLDDDNSHSV